LVPSSTSNGGRSICHALGTPGPCNMLNSQSKSSGNNSFFILGYDVFKLEPVCVDVTEYDSPYLSQDDSTLNGAFNQFYPEYDLYQVTLIKIDTNTSAQSAQSAKRRQQTSVTTGELTNGIFQVPGSLPDPLLNPCRSGDRVGNNFKCTNPIV